MRSALVLLFASILLAAPPDKDRPRPESAAAKPTEPAEPKPTVTRHQTRVGTQNLSYTATVGYLPISDDKGEREARMFYTAYSTGEARRPLVFCFNGGPGSASIWLHLGCIGPKRVLLLPDGQLPPPPFKLVDNEATWLDQADLVFIDPVGTGYSRSDKPELNKKFWNLHGDVESIGEFIRLYLTRNQRWTSPLFLAGESYGTTRASALSNYLVDKGIALNGVILISSILNFQTARFSQGNDLPYLLFLPTYATTAWFHHKLPAEKQALSVQEVSAQARTFAEGPYAKALWQGDQLSQQQRLALADQLAGFTGLSRTYLLEANLRPVIRAFTRELLRDRNRMVGRLESRFTALPDRGTSETSDFDPLLTAVAPPYTAAFNDYVRRDLGFESDLEYEALNGTIGRAWTWDADNQSVDTSRALAEAFRKNPYMKLMVASGYFDLGTPVFATEYTFAHMGLEPSQRERITLGTYEAGHMMYIDDAARKLLRRDVRGFIQNALNGGARLSSGTTTAP